MKKRPSIKAKAAAKAPTTKSASPTEEKAEDIDVNAAVDDGDDEDAEDEGAVAGLKPLSPSQLDDDAVDVGYMMAPLTREQIELVVLRLLTKHPNSIDVLEQELSSQIDEWTLRNEVITLMESYEHSNSTDSIRNIITKLQSFAERAALYTRVSGGAVNAVAVLDAIAEPLVTFVTHGDGTTTTENQSEVEQMFQTLETNYSNAFEQLAHSCAAAAAVRPSVMLKAQPQQPQQPHTAGGSGGGSSDSAVRLSAAALKRFEQCTANALKKLNVWKRDLTPLIGPIFSDPIRTLNRIIKQQISNNNNNNDNSTNHTSISISTPTATATATATTTATSKKRKHPPPATNNNDDNDDNDDSGDADATHTHPHTHTAVDEEHQKAAADDGEKETNEQNKQNKSTKPRTANIITSTTRTAATANEIVSAAAEAHSRQKEREKFKREKRKQKTNRVKQQKAPQSESTAGPPTKKVKSR